MRCSLVVDCCVLFVVGCSLFWCWLRVVRYLLVIVDCGSWFVVWCCVLVVVCRCILLVVDCKLLVVVSFVGCWWLVVKQGSVVRCWLLMVLGWS